MPRPFVLRFVCAALAFVASASLLHGRFQPYLVAGVGAYNVKTKLDDTAETEASKTQCGVNDGAGATLQLGVFRLYAERRVDNVFTDEGVIDTKSTQVVPVTFGIVY